MVCWLWKWWPLGVPFHYCGVRISRHGLFCNIPSTPLMCRLSLLSHLWQDPTVFYMGFLLDIKEILLDPLLNNSVDLFYWTKYLRERGIDHSRTVIQTYFSSHFLFPSFVMHKSVLALTFLNLQIFFHPPFLRPSLLTMEVSLFFWQVYREGSHL